MSDLSMINEKGKEIHVRIKTIAMIEIDIPNQFLPIILSIHMIKELIQPLICPILNTTNQIIQITNLLIQIETDQIVKMKEYTVVEALTRKGS